LVLVADQKQGFQMPQEFVCSPVFRQFHRRPADVAMILLQFSFKAAKQGESIGSRSCEPGQDLVLIEPPNLSRSVFNNRLAQSDLAIPGQYHLAVAANTENCRGAYKALLAHETKL